MKNHSDIIAANYCISFVDLLGQSAEYKDQGLLPRFKTSEDKHLFYEKIKNTIAPIYDLQKSAKDFIESALGFEGHLRANLPDHLQAVYDKMHEVKLKSQRWSDGLVYFISLQQGDVQCPMAGIFHMFGLIGSQCFLGLGKKMPIRGAIDISWGVELHPGEIYGPAVGNAYELESKIAQYPRIVIGERTIQYLEINEANTESGYYSEHNRSLAKKCLEMIAIDFDGYYILDYLGLGFKENITKNKHEELFNYALAFIEEQLVLWRKRRNTKLSFRYTLLYSYFKSAVEITKSFDGKEA